MRVNVCHFYVVFDFEYNTEEVHVRQRQVKLVEVKEHLRKWTSRQRTRDSSSNTIYIRACFDGSPETDCFLLFTKFETYHRIIWAEKILISSKKLMSTGKILSAVLATRSFCGGYMSAWKYLASCDRWRSKSGTRTPHRSSWPVCR